MLGKLNNGTKFLRLIALCLLVLLSSQSYASASDRYVFVLKWIGNPYWQAIEQGVKDAAKKSGIDAVVLTPPNDQAKEEHLNLCQAAMAQKPKIIVMGAATTAIGIECFREAQKRGIKVADIDATVTVDQAKKAGVDLAFTIGADNIQIGKRAAQFVAAHKKRDKPKILILEGVVGSPPSTDRVAGFKQEIAKLVPGAQIVNSMSAEWDRLRALNIASDTLVRAPDLDVIFAANDVMALGAVEAVRNSGKANQVLIIGVDGVPEALKAIRAGRMTASITQLPYLIGQHAVEKAVAAVQGKAGEKTERAPLLVLTKEVLEANKDPLLQYVR